MPRAAKKVEVDIVDFVNKEYRKEYGDDIITPASDPRWKMGNLSTGILSLDVMLKGGWKMGRHIELFGSESAGKTTIALRTIAATQAAGWKCAYVDSEKTFDDEYAMKHGVDTDALSMHVQRSGPLVVNAVTNLLASPDFKLIVIDSIAALIPAEELERAFGDKQGYRVGLASLMSEGLRRLTAANKHGAVILFINQLRENLGSIFGERQIPSGGKALSFYASTRLDIRVSDVVRENRKVIDHEGTEKTKQEPVAQRVQVSVKKNKAGSAYRGAQTTFVIDYATQVVDHVEDLIYLGLQLGLIKGGKDKKWHIGKGREYANRKAAKRAIQANPKLQQRLEAVIRERYGLAGPGSVGTPDLDGGQGQAEAAEPKRKPRGAKKSATGRRKTAAR